MYSKYKNIINHNYFNKLLKIKFLKNKVFTKNCVINSITTYEIQKRLKKILNVIYFFHISNQKILFIDNSLFSTYYIDLFKRTKHEVSDIDLLNINNLFKKVLPPRLVVMFNQNELLKEKFKKTNVPIISFNNSLNIFDGSTATYKVPGDFNTKQPKINKQSTTFFCQLISAVLKKARAITLNKDKYLWKLKKYLKKKRYYKYLTKENVINFDTSMPTFYTKIIEKNVVYFNRILRGKKYFNRIKWQVRSFKKLVKIPLWLKTNREFLLDWLKNYKQRKRFLSYWQRRRRWKKEQKRLKWQRSKGRKDKEKSKRHKNHSTFIPRNKNPETPKDLELSRQGRESLIDALMILRKIAFPENNTKESQLTKTKHNTKESQLTKTKHNTKESQLTKTKHNTKESQLTKTKHNTKESQLTKTKHNTKKTP